MEYLNLFLFIKQYILILNILYFFFKLKLLNDLYFLLLILINFYTWIIVISYVYILSLFFSDWIIIFITNLIKVRSVLYIFYVHIDDVVATIFVSDSFVFFIPLNIIIFINNLAFIRFSWIAVWYSSEVPISALTRYHSL